MRSVVCSGIGEEHWWQITPLPRDNVSKVVMAANVFAVTRTVHGLPMCIAYGEGFIGVSLMNLNCSPSELRSRCRSTMNPMSGITISAAQFKGGDAC
jgi:hypothetical protein